LVVKDQLYFLLLFILNKSKTNYSGTRRVKLTKFILPPKFIWSVLARTETVSFTKADEKIKLIGMLVCVKNTNTSSYTNWDTFSYEKCFQKNVFFFYQRSKVHPVIKKYQSVPLPKLGRLNFWVFIVSSEKIWAWDNYFKNSKVLKMLFLLLKNNRQSEKVKLRKCSSVFGMCVYVYSGNDLQAYLRFYVLFSFFRFCKICHW